MCRHEMCRLKENKLPRTDKRSAVPFCIQPPPAAGTNGRRNALKGNLDENDDDFVI